MEFKKDLIILEKQIKKLLGKSDPIFDSNFYSYIDAYLDTDLDRHTLKALLRFISYHIYCIDSIEVKCKGIYVEVDISTSDINYKPMFFLAGSRPFIKTTSEETIWLDNSILKSVLPSILWPTKH